MILLAFACTASIVIVTDAHVKQVIRPVDEIQNGESPPPKWDSEPDAAI